MSLAEFTIPTAIAESGMTVRELFTECVKADVAGLPFRAANGKFAGKASIRQIVTEVCIPQAMIEHARLLGDSIEALRLSLNREQSLFNLTIDDYIIHDAAYISPASPLAKALATMESYKTTYVFVIDAEQNYYGTLGIVSLARCLLKRNP
jgi:hypothetical protein